MLDIFDGVKHEEKGWYTNEWNSSTVGQYIWQSVLADFLTLKNISMKNVVKQAKLITLDSSYNNIASLIIKVVILLLSIISKFEIEHFLFWRGKNLQKSFCINLDL